MLGFISKGHAVVSAAAAAALLATAIGPAQAHRTSQATHAGGVLVFPISSSSLWIRSPDPALPTDLTSFTVTRQGYNGLVKLAATKAVPDLAAALPTASADHLRSTLKLRPNLKVAH